MAFYEMAVAGRSGRSCPIANQLAHETGVSQVANRRGRDESLSPPLVTFNLADKRQGNADVHTVKRKAAQPSGQLLT